MRKLMVHGATMSCTHGSCACSLSAEEVFAAMKDGKVAEPLLDEGDAPMPAFGTCAVSGRRCHPATSVPWFLAWPSALVLFRTSAGERARLRCFEAEGAEIAVEYRDEVSGELVESAEGGILGAFGALGALSRGWDRDDEVEPLGLGTGLQPTGSASRWS